MCKGFHNLQKDEKMVDVTIAAGGKIFKAHKLVSEKGNIFHSIKLLIEFLVCRYCLCAVHISRRSF